MTARTQKTTKVTDQDRIAALPEVKKQIRMTDPNLSSQEIERRALQAVGLPTGEDVDLEDVPEGGRPRRALRAVGRGTSNVAGRVRPVVTSSQARKTIGGVLILGMVIGVVRDVRSGDAIRTDVVPRRIIGSFLAAILLMMLAGPAPRVARGLAFLVGFTIVALNQDTIQRIAGSVTDESIDREGGTGTGVVDAAPGTPGGIPEPRRTPPELRRSGPS